MTSIIPINDEINLQPIYDLNLSHEFTNTHVAKESDSDLPKYNFRWEAFCLSAFCLSTFIIFLIFGILIFIGIKFKWDLRYVVASSIPFVFALFIWGGR